ncbi:hypothetical protein [Bacillus altitudinis]|uniref:hypothetical protein n=1 Tax=Bacillus altitudinis TaxID=293387 RepID=UPI001C222BED|nr:hypothetical protein [Bacillus altitudinis]MBU8855240.1 hypothetical protein [Bacillus sp. FJAT-26377]MCY7454324.1 hypothetical protein [Bacillus altitudinis]
MKKTIIFLFVSLIVISLTACSASSKSKEEIEQNALNTIVEDYEVQFNNINDESNNVLSAFNNALDGYYTKRSSNSTFKSILSEKILASSQFIKETEEKEVDTTVLSFHQQVVVYLNQQHQLLLDAVEMANENEVDKGTLRESYLNLKQQQVDMTNSWIELKQSILSGEEMKKR